jgi:hypothetical protein
MTILSYGYTGTKDTCVTSLFCLSDIHYWVGNGSRKTAPIFGRMAAANKTSKELHTFCCQKHKSDNALCHRCWSTTQARHWTKKTNLTQMNDSTFQQQ